MPTCDSKAKPTSLGTLTAAELDHHASEAAKVKRTKEQAYFNSYDFDAIEVLPYDEDEEEEEEQQQGSRSHTFKHQLQHQHHHHHGSLSGHHPKYTMGGCKACHQISQSASVSPAPAPGISATASHSHSLNNRPHHHQSQSLGKKKPPPPTTFSQSSSSHSSSTSSSLSSFAHPMNATDSKRTYLERIGAFFTSHSVGKRSSVESLTDIEKQPQQTSSSATSSQISLDNNIRSVRKLYDDSGREHVVDDTVNSNFLLPRAMLKYQSTGGFGNSMPLAVISNLGGSSTSLKSNSISGQLIQVTNGSSSHSKSQPNTVESSISATDAVNPKKPSALVAVKAAENSGFASSSSSAASSATASAAASVSASSSSLAKSSLSPESSIIGETSSNADVNGAAAPSSSAALASKSITNAVGSIASNLKQSFAEKLVPSTTSSSSSAAAASGASGGGGTAASSSSGSLTTTTGANGDAANATRGSSGRGARERTSSQSHYSTDKSGSSGYYSSNVCSTYSVEDHIYCEPVIDILEVSQSTTLKPSKLGQEGSGSTRKIMIVHNSDDDDEDHPRLRRHRPHDLQRQQENMKQNLRILETSIENLDRHLKNYPRLSAQDRLASFARANPQTIPTNCFQIQGATGGGFDAVKNRYGHLPTIMEGGAGDGQSMALQKSWQEEIAEDSLLDIDLDSFLLVSEGKSKSSSALGGIDNPTFNKSDILHDEDMENNYKCAKYINSCPEDAYGLESEVGTTLDHFLKKYEDQIHFQSTRELLEDVRDKIRLLSESSEAIDSTTTVTVGRILDKHLPQELESMIKALKSELESYLERMNQHSEMEIRQLCTGLVKNQNIVKMKKAFERRKSNASDPEYDFAYEAIRDGGTIVTVQHTRQHIETTSIRCTSDPNFKMKRKSLCEVFPSVDAECYVGTVAAVGVNGGAGADGRRDASASQAVPSGSGLNMIATASPQKTQMQRNLSFHKPILNQLSNGEPTGDGDKESILDWHSKKPSIWEMYYGTNRMNQTLLGKRGVITNGNQAILSYPSSRPESDFTLDLPRAEQLRIKMEKEKKFRRRCRYLTTFLSLVFFLLTVMVVSLVLTRGKRMFGSMI